MTMEMAVAFLMALLVWVAIPGPAILMVVGRSLSSGFRSALALIGGILLGDVLYMLLALFGLAAIGQLLGETFVVVRVLAALYLIYLGVSLWLADPQTQLARAGAAGGDTLRSFVTGFGLTLGNPKAILFHLGFLPTFFDLQALGVADAVAIIGIFIGVLGASLALYAYAASRATGFFRSPRRMRLLNRTAGGLLVGAGATVLLKRS